jgi:ATP-binding cassette subfamily B protein
VFARLPPEALRELHRRITIRRVGTGAVIVREGDPGQACYVVQRGCVRILKRDPAQPAAEQIEVARLGPGALFGEFALLADRRRHATVQAIEPTELYEIPRRLLRELAATYPPVGPALERLYRERLLSTLIATAPFFRPLPEEERGRLMSRFQPRRVEAGKTIVREGEAGGGLYLLVLGTVDITKKVDGARAVLLASLGEGCYFGEMSLLRGTFASATVTAAGPVELAHLPPKEFYDVLAEYPVLWDELRREAERRELINQNIVAGETRVV